MENEIVKDLDIADYKLTGLSKINILLGRNGCGKSTVLRAVDKNSPASFDAKRYISPERSGSLLYEASVDMNIRNNSSYMMETRRANQVQQFKQQSVANFNILHLAILQKYHDTSDKAFRLEPVEEALNMLLENRRYAAKILKIRLKSPSR